MWVWKTFITKILNTWRRQLKLMMSLKSLLRLEEQVPWFVGLVTTPEPYHEDLRLQVSYFVFYTMSRGFVVSKSKVLQYSLEFLIWCRDFLDDLFLLSRKVLDAQVYTLDVTTPNIIFELSEPLCMTHEHLLRT